MTTTTSEQPRSDAAVVDRFVFGRDGRLLTGTPSAHLSHSRSDDPAFADRVQAHLAARGGIALGTLSFRRDEPSTFAVIDEPRTVVASDVGVPRGDRQRATVAERPPSPRWARTVAQVVDRITADPGLAKVVLARWLEIRPERTPEAGHILGRLAARSPDALLFRLPAGPDVELVGASPELLVSRRGDRVSSLPLAGSAPRLRDPRRDAAGRAALLDSAKDRHEHRLVVDALRAELEPWCVELDVADQPRLVGTDTMWHLGTPITARLAPGPAPSALHLAQLLHPTPALCGTPRAAAYDLIEEVEGPRGLMGGAVGWVDGRGDGDFAVVIRAALVGATRIDLFAGAGIVAGSRPDLEVAETDAKLQTMLQALDLEER